MRKVEIVAIDGEGLTRHDEIEEQRRERAEQYYDDLLLSVTALRDSLTPLYPDVQDSEDSFWEVRSKRKSDLKELRELRKDLERARAELGLCPVAPPHHYTLLASSLGSFVESDSLSTVECLEFLLGLAHRGRVVCGFSINYDCNMWLRDVDLETLSELWKGKAVWWNGYQLTYQPSKLFRIKHDGVMVTVWDVFGFFQRSFIKTLEEWKIAEEAELEAISLMKDLRGYFEDEDAESVRVYCLRECELTSDLVGKLLAQFEAVGLRLRRYDGAGAAAAAALSKYRIKQFLAPLPEAVGEAAQAAYYGGRFESAGTGLVDSAYLYDINSAYPAEMEKLPCLVCGKWYKSVKLHRHGVYHVEWRLNGNEVFGPFPSRSQQGRISYPDMGRGWYWGAEVLAAQRLYPGAITVLSGFRYRVGCDHWPFEYVPAMYRERKAREAKGDFGQLVLKLTLNAGYGKLAQTISFDPDIPPPYHSWVWAGMITAGTRAKILEIIGLSPSSILSIATDGVISIDKLPITGSSDLGAWGVKAISDLFMVQNGVYSYSYEGVIKTRARGYRGKEFDFDALKEVWDQRGMLGTLLSSVSRFVGLGAALATAPALRDWRRWIQFEKKVKFWPPSRRVVETRGEFVRTLIPLGVDMESQPYKAKGSWAEVWALDEVGLLELEQPTWA